MVIKDSNGKTFMLQGPNRLSRNSGKFWDFSNIKYVNFSQYGDLILLDPVKLIEPVIPPKEKKPEKQEYLPQNNLEQLGNVSLEDNYLNDNFDKELEVEKYNSNENDLSLSNSERVIEGGSPVIYQYTDPISGPKERKIYAQIEDQDNNIRIYIISKKERIQIDNIIMCEWEKSSWKIVSVIPENESQKIITTKK